MGSSDNFIILLSAVLKIFSLLYVF